MKYPRRLSMLNNRTQSNATMSGYAEGLVWEPQMFKASGR